MKKIKIAPLLSCFCVFSAPLGAEVLVNQNFDTLPPGLITETKPLGEAPGAFQVAAAPMAECSIKAAPVGGGQVLAFHTLQTNRFFGPYAVFDLARLPARGQKVAFSFDLKISEIPASAKLPAFNIAVNAAKVGAGSDNQNTCIDLSIKDLVVGHVAAGSTIADCRIQAGVRYRFTLTFDTSGEEYGWFLDIEDIASSKPVYNSSRLGTRNKPTSRGIPCQLVFKGTELLKLAYDGVATEIDNVFVETL